MDIETTVLARYSEGARERQEALCCPVRYDPDLLRIIPDEILEKDYGCGDPSAYVRTGDVVLDLGSGGGKICYLAAQLVGEEGRVIGVDMNDDMLALARKYQSRMAKALGNDRVSFKKGQIQNLALDLDGLDEYLRGSPVCTQNDYQRLCAWQEQQCKERPLIADASVDLVISNCVLNLVQDADKQQLVREIFRVLKPGGRVAVSDIISDEACGEELKQNPELWSGCLSGAFQETAFLQAFSDAGFVAVKYDQWDPEVWRVVEGIEFRSALLTAVKPAMSMPMDRGHAVMYRGPYAQIRDEEGQVYPRGVRMAVSDHTFALLTSDVYDNDFIGFTPARMPAPRQWCSSAHGPRPVSETRGGVQSGSSAKGCCG